jgi:hypothetical protein
MLYRAFSAFPKDFIGLTHFFADAARAAPDGKPHAFQGGRYARDCLSYDPALALFIHQDSGCLMHVQAPQRHCREGGGGGGARAAQLKSVWKEGTGPCERARGAITGSTTTRHAAAKAPRKRVLGEGGLARKEGEEGRGHEGQGVGVGVDHGGWKGGGRRGGGAHRHWC